jgi:hypothetical protein
VEQTSYHVNLIHTSVITNATSSVGISEICMAVPKRKKKTTGCSTFFDNGRFSQRQHVKFKRVDRAR